MTDAVRIEIPATTRYLAFARVAAASMVVDLDPDVDQVDDLRVAVDELVGLLIEASHGHGTVQIEMRVDGTTITVEGRSTDPSAAPRPDELARRIISATADGWSLDSASFSLHKNLARD